MRPGIQITAIVSIALFGSAAVGNSARATELDAGVANCFLVESTGSDDPANLPLDAIAYRGFDEWCVKGLVSDPSSQLIFKKSGENFSPGSFFLLTHRPDGTRRLRETFVLKGRVGVSETDPDVFNPMPFSVDQLEPQRLNRAFGARNLRLSADFMAKPANSGLLERLLKGRARPMWEIDFAQTQEFMLPPERYPFKGYWWPHENLELASGKTSPLGKYDDFIENRTGRDPVSREWEIKYHSLQNVDWGGHCNGWVASSVLYPEPTQPLWDSRTQTLFQVSDIKGIMAEASFCVDWAFYGVRYNAKPGEDIRDISPDRFHNVMSYYLQQQQKPLALDYYSNERVDNHIVSGVKFEYTLDPTLPDEVRVKATLRMHEYELSRHEMSGHATIYNRVYEYMLKFDPTTKKVLGGSWITDNPDFVWVPLAQKDCGRENPRIKMAYVDEISKLPAAQTVSLPLNVAFDQVLQPGEEVSVFEGELRGMLRKVRMTNNSIASYDVYLVVETFPAYTFRDNDLPRSQEYAIAGLTELPLSSGGMNLRSLKLVNRSSQPVALGGLRVESVEVLGGL